MTLQAQELKEQAGFQALENGDRFDIRKAIESINNAEADAYKVQSETYFYPDEPRMNVSQLHIRVLTMRDFSVFVFSLKLMKGGTHSESFVEVFDNYEKAERVIEMLMISARDALEPNVETGALLQVLNEMEAFNRDDASEEEVEEFVAATLEKLNAAGVDTGFVENEENGINQKATQNAPSEDEITH